MTYLVLVEPADERRRAFARWCLAQNPPIMTASSTGSEIPADLFTTMPEELLEGAYVDGHIYRHVADEAPDPAPEPVKAPLPRRNRNRQLPTGKAAGK